RSLSTVARGTPKRSLCEIVAQDDGAVVLGISRAVEQRHRAAVRGLENRLPGVGIRVQLGAVSLPELFPALDAMAEPLTQLGARRHVLHPRVGREVFLLHAARPESLDEKSPAIRARGRVVSALDANH